jgi:hypothetical protein
MMRKSSNPSGNGLENPAVTTQAETTRQEGFTGSESLGVEDSRPSDLADIQSESEVVTERERLLQRFRQAVMRAKMLE